MGQVPPGASLSTGAGPSEVCSSSFEELPAASALLLVDGLAVESSVVLLLEAFESWLSWASGGENFNQDAALKKKNTSNLLYCCEAHDVTYQLLLRLAHFCLKVRWLVVVRVAVSGALAAEEGGRELEALGLLLLLGRGLLLPHQLAVSF